MLLIFTSLIVTAICGHIAIWDIELDYSNAGYATQYTIPFQLTNPLPSYGYLKIVFPYSLHYTYTNNIPDGMSASYRTTVGDRGCGVGKILTAKVFVNGADEPNTYYLQFYDPKNELTQLMGGYFYIVNVLTSGNNVNIQSAGVKYPLQLYSVTSLSKLAMIIDINPSAHVFSLDTEPNNEMKITIKLGANSGVLNAAYSVAVTVQFKKQLPEGGRIQLEFYKSDGFTFEQGCTIMGNLTYNCIMEDSKLSYSLPGNILVNDLITFTTWVRNPLRVTKATTLKVKSLQLYANTIVETQESDAVFIVQQLVLQSHSLQLGWGLEYSSRSAYFYPFPIIVFRGDINKRYNPFNAFRWLFTFGVDLSEEIRLQVEIQTPMKFGSFLMPGSISHNLPSYSGQNVQCIFQGQNELSKSKIVCKNVGQLYKQVKYFIGCRATFPYDEFNLPLQQKFGQLGIYTVSGTVIDTLSLIVESNPVDYIQTSNNPDWTVSSHVKQFDGTVVSSQDASAALLDPSGNRLGLYPNLVDGEVSMQRLIFNLAIKITDIVSLAGSPVPNQVIPYSAGIIILGNDKLLITTTDPPLLEPTASNQWFRYEYKSSVLAHFLEIKVGSTDVNGLLTMYAYNTNELLGQFNQFAIKNVQIKFHSSQYADEYLLDFYIGTFDQIDSAYPIFKNSFLCNAYTLTTPKPLNIRLGIVNYYTSNTGGNQGDYFPTMLRLSGYFTESDLENSSNKLSVFFSNMMPFYESNDFESNNQVACKFTGLTQPICTYYPAGTLGNGQSYTNYERVDLVFESLPTSPEDAFQLLIPMRNSINKNSVSVFIAAIVSNPYYASGNTIQLRTVFRLTGDANLMTNQYAFTVSSTLLGSGFIKSGILNPTYNIQTSGLIVGTNGTSYTFNIGHSDSANLVLANSKLNDYSNGAGFTLTSTAQLHTSDTTYTTSISISTTKVSSCQSFRYTYEFNSLIPNYRYGIYCPLDKGSESSTTTLTLISANLPFINGVKLPIRTSFTWSDCINGLSSFKVDTTSVLPNAGTVRIINVLPNLIIGLKQQVLSWRFSTTNPIPQDSLINIEFNAAITFTFINQGQRCNLVSDTYGTIQHTCTITDTTTLNPIITFKITNCPGCPMPPGSFTLQQWGIDKSTTAGVKVSYHMRTISTQSNTIDSSKLMGSLNYDNTASLPTMYLGNVVMQFTNKRARGTMKVDFQVSRSIWKQEYVLIDLGGFYGDNQRNKNNLKCQVLDSLGKPSLLWKIVDYTLEQSSSLSGVKMYPRDDILGSLTFTFKCNGIVMPYSYNPAPMIGYLVLANSFTTIESSNAIALDVLVPLPETSFPVSNIKLAYKSNNAPGSQVDMLFNFTSTLIDVSLGTTIFVVFPTTYPAIVSSNLTYCSLNNQFVACSVKEDYTVVLENFDITILKGQQAQVRIFGAQQSYLFNSEANEIFVGLTKNLDTKVLSEYGTAFDVQPQNMELDPPKRVAVQWFQISDNYIRSISSFTFKVSLPPGSVNVDNVIHVDFPAAWDMIINYKLPNCALYDFTNTTNYAKQCTNFGNRITMTIKQTDYIGSVYYYLTLSNVRNPDYSVCGVDQWVISVLKTKGTYVMGRSHAPNGNVQPLPFISNPAQITLKWVDLSTMKQITTLQVKTGVQIGQVGLASDSGAFVRSFEIFSMSSLFIANPSSTRAPMGYSYTSALVAGSSSAPQGLQLIEFGKTDDFDRHTPLPFLRVFLSQSSYVLKTEASAFTLPIGGQALPILFNLTLMQPATNLRVESTLSSEKMYFKSKSSITFGPSVTMGAFVFAGNDNGLSVGDSGVITFTLAGTYQKYYSSIDAVSYRIVDYNKKRPISYLYTNNAERGSNYLTFTVSCNQYAAVYYLLAINGSEILFSDEIYNNALLFQQPDIADYYNQHFGIKNIYIPQQNYTVVITDLRPSTQYNMTTICMNTETRMSQSQSVVSTTKSNNGKAFYIEFIFESAIDIEFSRSITCFLTLYFKVPARLVRNSLNIWCDYQRRRLLNSMNISDYSERSVRMYVNPIDFELQDQVTSKLYQSTLNKTYLALQLNDIVAGLPALIKISDLMPINTVVPQFVNESDINVTFTQTQVTITNIEIDIEGFIYAMIDWQNRTKQPSFYQIREGSSLRIDTMIKANISTLPQYYERQRFNKSGTLNFTFTELTHYTNYSLFYYAASDDPSEHQLRTYVHQVDFTTLPNYVQSTSIITIFLLLILIVQ